MDCLLAHMALGMQPLLHPLPLKLPQPGVDVVRDPTDLPAPLEAREPTTVRIDLEAVEVEGQLADGTTFTYWTFNGAVPVHSSACVWVIPSKST